MDHYIYYYDKTTKTGEWAYYNSKTNSISYLTDTNNNSITNDSTTNMQNTNNRNKITYYPNTNTYSDETGEYSLEYEKIFHEYDLSDEQYEKMCRLIATKNGDSLVDMVLATSAALNRFETECNGEFEGYKGNEALAKYLFEEYFKGLKPKEGIDKEELQLYVEAAKIGTGGMRNLPLSVTHFTHLNDIKKIIINGKEYTELTDISNNLVSGDTTIFTKDGDEFIYLDCGIPKEMAVTGGNNRTINSDDKWYNFLFEVTQQNKTTESTKTTESKSTDIEIAG